MRMRQSLADFESALLYETELDRRRRESLSRTASQRSHKRQIARTHQRGSKRFGMLVFSIIATAVVVTVAMFETLYYVMG